MAKKKGNLKTKKQAIVEMFAEEEGERFTLIVLRDGNARQREMLVNGNIRLGWRADNNSVPIELPAGTYVLKGIILGKSGQTWGFSVISPKDQPLDAGELTALGADSFEREVTIP